MNSLRIKSVDIDEVFIVLVKIMKKVKLEVGLKSPSLMGWRGRLLWVQLDFVARKPCCEKILLEIGDLLIQFVFE